MIVYESYPYRDGPNVLYFKHHYGATPICRLSLVGDRWEVWFYRGAPPGPYSYASFAKAKRHLCRYLEPRAEQLKGPPIKFG